MRPAKKRAPWLRQPAPSQPLLASPDELLHLRKEAKKIAILTRIEQRARTNDSAYSRPRPSSTNPRKPIPTQSTIRDVEQLCLREKSLTREALSEVGGPRERGGVGLLGEWGRYEEMSKHELIEKLISLEHLANTIFKRNKFLEEEMRKLQQPD